MSTANRSWVPLYVTSSLTRRRFLRAAAAGSGALALIACGGGASSVKLKDSGSAREPGTVWRATSDWTIEDETKQAVRGGIYRGWRSADQEGHYDSITLPSSQAPFSAHVHEMLMGQQTRPGIDPSSLEASDPIGMLAESWEFNPDGTVITFRMRQGVKWHPIAPVNGRVMDIDDWRTSHERHMVSGPHRAFLEKALDTAEFPDSRTMIWRLKAPHSPIFEQIFNDKALGYPIQPKELNASPALAETVPIGTGYKILDNHQRATTMEYRKHTEYWDGEPFIDRWHVPIIPEYANQYAQFLRGNIIDFTPTARDVLLLHRDAPEAVIVANPVRENQATRMRWGRINPDNQAWSDPRVRIAVRRSVDWRGIGRFLSNAAEFEAAGIPVEIRTTTHLNQHPGYWLNPDKGELGTLSANYLYDVAEAKKLKSAAGQQDVIELPFYVDASGGTESQDDQLVMDSLNASGLFGLKVHRSSNSTEHRQYRSLGQMEGIAAESGSGEYDADYFLFEDYHSQGVPKTELPLPYIDPRMERIAEAQRREIDIERRYALLKEWQLLAAEIMPSVPGRDLYNIFWFRWPWLRNFNWGESSITPRRRTPALGWPSPLARHRDAEPRTRGDVNSERRRGFC
jgi:ABC-type transport system substrate-binding protein